MDLNRIDRILGWLEKSWKIYPDLRLYQLLKAALVASKSDIMDRFYLEDETIETALAEFYFQHSNEKQSPVEIKNEKVESGEKNYYAAVNDSGEVMFEGYGTEKDIIKLLEEEYRDDEDLKLGNITIYIGKTYHPTVKIDGLKPVVY